MNKYVKIGSVVFGMIALAVSTAFSQISAGINPKANLGAYKTFAWLEPDIKAGPNPLYKSEMLNNTVKMAVSTELNIRGMKEDTLAPDALIQFHTYTQPQQRTNYSGGFYPFLGGWGWGRWGSFFPYGGMGWGGNGYQSNSTEGTLVVDILDAKTKEVLWEGVIQGTLNGKVNRIQNQINSGVTKVFKKHFPVPIVS